MLPLSLHVVYLLLSCHAIAYTLVPGPTVTSAGSEEYRAEKKAVWKVPKYKNIPGWNGI